jgi:hypothetical protein
MITAGEAATLSFQHRRIPGKSSEELATDLYLLRIDILIRNGILEGACRVELYIFDTEQFVPTYDKHAVIDKVCTRLEGSSFQTSVNHDKITVRWQRLNKSESDEDTGSTWFKLFRHRLKLQPVVQSHHKNSAVLFHNVNTRNTFTLKADQ